MSNELLLHCSLRHPQLNKGSDNGPFRSDLADDEIFDNFQEVSTVAAALALGNITSPRWMKYKNESSTDGEIIRISQSSSDTNCVQVSPGAEGCFEFDDTDATAPYVIADSGTPRLTYTLTGPAS